jgi:hypothetical protein
MTTDWNKVRGAVALTSDAVEHGSRAVEKVHLETAARPFNILKAIPVVSAPASVVHVVHDLCVTSVYWQIRMWNRLVRAVVGRALPQDTAPLADSAPTSTTPQP